MAKSLVSAETRLNQFGRNAAQLLYRAGIQALVIEPDPDFEGRWMIHQRRLKAQNLTPGGVLAYLHNECGAAEESGVSAVLALIDGEAE
jgi:hypothetical protein